jgi:lipoate---protein ligase
MEGDLKPMFAASASLSKKEGISVYLDSTRDPGKNLTREEEIFRRVERRELPELVRLWSNSECLVRGRARNSKYGWYNENLVREMEILVVERPTGGGVVYHDEGNLNWSFFFRNSGAFVSPGVMFERTSEFVVKALGRLGVAARFAPPNRIDVSGRKVSGMAARSTAKAHLVHGTLLLDSNLERLNSLCIPPVGCPPVANVGEWVKGINARKVLDALVGVLGDSGYSVETSDPLA